jgi:recombination protein RecA
MDKKIKDALDKLNKNFGEGCVMTFDKESIKNVERFSSGSLGLDIALGGGWPKGRIVEMYGPESSGKSTLALHAIAEVHKNGGIAGYVDAEHAFDPIYAENLGVHVSDKDKFFFSQPSNGDEAIEVVRELTKTGLFDLIIVDSVAALTPKAELAGDVGDSKMGLHARLMSQAMRMLTGEVSKTNTTIFFINQLRDKIGVMFGCLHYSTKIVFGDGRSLPIGEVVKNKIKGDVWSFNEENNKFELKPILDWHNNGNISSKEDFIHIETRSINGKGRFGVTVTPDHKIMSFVGWKSALELRLGDKILSKYESIINGTLGNFLWGSFVGDSHIQKRGNFGYFKLRDSKNPDYLHWKINKLSPFIKFSKNGDNQFDSENIYELNAIKSKIGNRNPLCFFDNYSDIGLAIWYMDDGHYDCSREKGRYRCGISIKRFATDLEVLLSVVDNFKKLGISCSFRKDGYITFNKENSDLLFERIKKFIPESMQYKLPIKFQGEYEDFNLSCEKRIVSEYVEVLMKRFISDRQFRDKGKFDISVQDNHNYLAGGYRNGVIVHNSPETTTGGNALKFYASIRCDIRRISQNKDGDSVVVSNKTRVKVVKNKTFPPFRQCEFDIVFGKGISLSGEVIDAASELGIVKKAGSWFSYGETKLGQGRDSVIDILNDNPELVEELRQKIFKAI